MTSDKQVHLKRTGTGEKSLLLLFHAELIATFVCRRRLKLFAEYCQISRLLLPK